MIRQVHRRFIIMQITACLLLLLSLTSICARRDNIAKGSRLRSSQNASASRGLKKSKSSRNYGPSERDCKLKSKKEKVEYECDSRGEDIRDKIKFKVEAKGSKSLKIEIEYKQKGSGIDDELTEEVETEFNTKYEIIFDKIVEYQKKTNVEEDEAKSPLPLPDSEDQQIAINRQVVPPLDGNSETVPPIVKSDENDEKEEEEDPYTQAFDWDNDKIVQEWAIEDWEDFSDIDDDGSLIKFSVTSQDQITKFFFTIAREDLEELTPNKMKIDFELSDFPWKEEDSYVALLCLVTSGQNVKIKDDTSDSHKGHKHKKAVEISFDEATDRLAFVPIGEYTWKTEAEATPRDIILMNETETNSTSAIETRSIKTIQVIATSPTTSDTEDDSDRIAFSFVGKSAQRAIDIYWDPSAGVGYGSGAIGEVVTLAFALSTFFSLLSLLQ